MGVSWDRGGKYVDARELARKALNARRTKRLTRPGRRRATGGEDRGAAARLTCVP